MWGKIATAAAALLAGAAYGQMMYPHGKIVACYYSSWAFYRPGIGSFDVDDIDPRLCSHGFYGFADLNNATWKIDAIDPNFDYSPEECEGIEGLVCQYSGFERFVQLKQRNSEFKAMLSIGGWNAGSGEYSIMAKNPGKTFKKPFAAHFQSSFNLMILLIRIRITLCTKYCYINLVLFSITDYRRTFVESVVPYLDKYGFDGLDIDWEYPGGREGADLEQDKDNFSLLIQELAEELHNNGKILTAAMAAGFGYAEAAYDIPALVPYFDFFNIMCYDYHGWFPNHEHTGHNAPLRGYIDEDFEDHPGYRFNTMATVDMYLEWGVPVEMMAIGFPAYGRGFQVVDPEINGLYCPADDGNPMGPYTRQLGNYGYLEVLQLFNNGSYLFMPEAEPNAWEVHVDDCYHAPYVTNGPYWIGYDDVESLSIKAKYANFIGAAGVMMWTVETDDFGAFYSRDENGNQISYPLLRALNEVLLSGETYDPASDASNCEVVPDDWCDILAGLTDQCEEDRQKLPFPGGCHDYFRCRLVEGGDTPDDPDDDVFEIDKASCADFVYDPIDESCIQPNLPGTSLLCDRVE